MSKGRFGIHGGQYISETLMNTLIELEEAYDKCKNDPEFQSELTDLMVNYAGRPSLLYYAEKMTADLGGPKIYLKREDLNHTGAHKINNVLGQCLLAKKMGKTRVIAETGAGQHGVATATVAALMGMPRFSILDPQYTLTLPKYQMVAGIYDIFNHICEQYFSGSDDNTSDYISEGLMRSVITSGRAAVIDPQDYEARSNLMWTATWALNTLIDRGKTTDWMVHMYLTGVENIRDVLPFPRTPKNAEF